MYNLSEAAKQKDDSSKCEFRTVTEDEKNTKSSAREDLDSCPGANKCKQSTNTHEKQYVILFCLLPTPLVPHTYSWLNAGRADPRGNS
jgi:hypothetical protein